MSAPRVSIVTPTYNRAPLLRETIDSILSQSFQDFEYIVIDDGSSDDTAEVVSDYGSKLTYLHHENRGEAASTNRGFEQASGEYFAMVSSDDPMLPDWLDQAVAFMDRHPDVLVAYPDWVMIDLQSEMMKTVTVYEYSAEKLYGWVHCLPGPGAIIRKSVLDPDYRLRSPELRYVSDLESWFRLGLLGKFARIPAVLATWRFHDGSVSIADQSLARSTETLSTVYGFYAQDNLPKDIKGMQRMAMSRANYLASVFVRNSFPLKSMIHLLKSIWIMPFQPASMPPEIRRAPFSRMLASVLRGK